MDNFELRYSSKDTERLLDLFCELDRNNMEKSVESIMSLAKEYPTEVVDKFLRAVSAINEDLITSDNMMGIIAYITLRINL